MKVQKFDILNKREKAETVLLPDSDVIILTTRNGGEIKLFENFNGNLVVLASGYNRDILVKPLSKISVEVKNIPTEDEREKNEDTSKT